jgi:hypothetical protein
MPDITTISAILGSIKTATDIAKAIKNADISLEKAELKLKIAELTESLADIKIKAVEIRDLIEKKDLEISILRKQLEPQKIIIPKESEQILKYLASIDGKVPEKDLLDQTGHTGQKARYYLEILESLGLVISFYSPHEDPDQRIRLLEFSYNGRKYFFDHY